MIVPGVGNIFVLTEFAHRCIRLLAQDFSSFLCLRFPVRTPVVRWLILPPNRRNRSKNIFFTIF